MSENCTTRLEGVTGKYLDKCKAVRSSDVTYDETLQEQLWRLSLRQLQWAAAMLDEFAEARYQGQGRSC